jgi:hypothetical protein
MKKLLFLLIFFFITTIKAQETAQIHFKYYDYKFSEKSKWENYINTNTYITIIPSLIIINMNGIENHFKVIKEMKMEKDRFVWMVENVDTGMLGMFSIFWGENNKVLSNSLYINEEYYLFHN